LKEHARSVIPRKADQQREISRPQGCGTCWQNAGVRRFNLHTPEFDGGSERDGFRSRSAAVAKALGAEQIGGRLYELGDGQHASPYHLHHAIEEWVLVVAGTPSLRTPEGERTLRPGDVVCFPAGPAGAHRVTGPGTVLLLSDRRSPDVLEFPDSGTVRASPPGMLFRRTDAVDLWDVE
jgi:uncharacterized cupin superfamily protein